MKINYGSFDDREGFFVRSERRIDVDPPVARKSVRLYSLGALIAAILAILFGFSLLTPDKMMDDAAKDVPTNWIHASSRG